MQERINLIVDGLNGAPTEECVIRGELLEDLGIDPFELGRISGRPVRSVLEHISLHERSMQLRDKVFLYGPKENV